MALPAIPATPVKRMKHRDFKGVWIPKELYLTEGLTWTQKLILLEVHSFSSNGRPCFVSNAHLATFCQVSASTVEKAIKALVSEGYLTRTRQRRTDPDTGEKLNTYTRILTVDPRKIEGIGTVNNTATPTENLRHTKYSRPNTPTKPKKEATPLNITVVEEAFLDCGSTEQEAQKFYDYYSANGWTQGRGKKIVDWKAAARAWIRRAKEFNTQTRNDGFRPDNLDASRLANYAKYGN